MRAPISPENANRYPTSFGPSGIPFRMNRRSAYKAKPEKKVANANVNAKNCQSSGPRCLSLNEAVIAPQRDPPLSSSACECGRADGRRKYVHMMLVKDRAAAANIGYVLLYCARQPEIPGPTR